MSVSNGPNRVYTNDGTGTFTDSAQELGSSYSTSVALGDIDDDGDLDMIVGNGIDQPNRIYTNDGTGIFTDSGQALGSSDSTSVALGDIDADGDLDLVVGNQYFSPSRVYYNDGSGSFQDSVQEDLGYTYRVNFHRIRGYRRRLRSRSCNWTNLMYGHQPRSTKMTALSLATVTRTEYSTSVRSRTEQKTATSTRSPTFASQTAIPMESSILATAIWMEMASPTNAMFQRRDSSAALNNWANNCWGFVPGDVDGDADLDLIVIAGDKGPYLQLYTNTGSGYFQPNLVPQHIELRESLKLFSASSEMWIPMEIIDLIYIGYDSSWGVWHPCLSQRWARLIF